MGGNEKKRGGRVERRKESEIREREGVKERGEVMREEEQEKRKHKGERGKCR